MCRMPQKMLQEANLVFLCKEVLDVFDTKLEVEGKKMYLLFAIFTEGEILVCSTGNLRMVAERRCFQQTNKRLLVQILASVCREKTSWKSRNESEISQRGETQSSGRKKGME